jgi:hypothetical protein
VSRAGILYINSGTHHHLNHSLHHGHNHQGTLAGTPS